MPRKVDPEVLAGFIEEARGYLPKIREGIEAFHARPGQGDTLEEAHRHAHTIKGAGSMVGLNGLSTMANQLEEALEELMTSDRLPDIDETVGLLRQIVNQIELYLDGEAGKPLPEKPLLEEAKLAFDQIRSLPTEDRSQFASGDESSSSSPAEKETDAADDPLSGHLEQLRSWIKEAALGAPGDMATIRQPFELLQDEASRLGRHGVAEALHRLGLMTEVWECLAAEGPVAAEEVVAFCERALDVLAQDGYEGGAEVATSWILEESADRWGEYLALLDPSHLDAPQGHDGGGFAQPYQDGPSESLDSDALLRLLTGMPSDAPELSPKQPAAPLWPSHAPAAQDFAADASKADVQVEEGASLELREIFALEAQDHLRNLSSLLPALEGQPDNKEFLQDIRRSAHTIKGSAAMVGLPSITQLAHRMEDLLDQMYEGSRAVTPEIIRLLFASTDTLEDMVTGQENAEAVGGLYVRYDELLGPVTEEAAVAAPAAPEAAATPLAAEILVPATRDRAPRRAEPKARPAKVAASRDAEVATLADLRKLAQFVRFPIERLDELVKLLGELVITRTFLEQRMTDLVRQVAELEHSSDRLRRVSARLETQYEAIALIGGGGGRPAPAGNGHGKGNGNGYPPSLTSQTHGFDDLEFDRYTEFHILTRSLSETTNDIQTVAGELGGVIGDFDSYLNRQARLSSEVEDKLMRSRMVPMSALASRLQRTVRSVANQQGKQVELVLEGESTELDKTVLEEMADPLLHLIRNSVDHGIESPDLRLAIGKPAHGVIRLRADYVGSQVVIQISDDGAGIDTESLRSTAVERGFITNADAAKMPDSELFALLYLPGFSTAQQISEVSGRGVGLDIVRANVHKLKGTLALESQAGHGTTFTIRLPMTMAVMRAILVKTHQETFAIPLGAVRQIIRLDQDEMERVGMEPVVRVGGQVYPVYSLGQVLGLKQPADEAVTRRPILILDVGSRQVAVLVDHVLGGREIVLKTLGNHLRRVSNLMGATLMGDGSVVLILDPVELVREAVESRASSRPARTAKAAAPRDSLSVLVVDDSPSVRRVLTNLIKNAGWKPVTAKDGLDALETLHHSANAPDLILLDVEMPRMDGYELLATLRSQEAYQSIPVVMVTSRAGDKHRRKALDLGASGYVIKPYQDEAMLNVIRHLVRESRSKQVVHA
jgi:chemosensory pili system protein ChpA (sensor histidine kinase/response regulator)